MFLEIFNLSVKILFLIKSLESLTFLELKYISLVCSGKLIFVSRPILLAFDFVSSIFISFKTEFNSILFDLSSSILVGKFADASVIISFCATSIADEMPTIE